MTDKPTALIMTANKFEDFELFFPYFRLLEEGFAVEIAAPKKGHLEGEHGYGIEVEKEISDVDPERYDLLIIPGGSPDGAPGEVRRFVPAQRVTRAFMKADKPVASICHGPWALAAADSIKGRKLTSYWHDGVPEDIKKAGGEYIDAEVVVDRNLVTSRYPGDLPAFVSATLKMFQKQRKPRTSKK